MKTPYDSDARLNSHGTDRFDIETAQFASCRGKQSFNSWEEADRVIRSRRRRAKAKTNTHKNARADRASLHPYRCRHCHHWHIGRSSR